MSCYKCSKTHSTVQAFLLTCCACNRKWHHRCHAPPVADRELIARIKAHNVGDSANSLQAWKCQNCTRSGVGSVEPNILNPPPLHASTPPFTTKHDRKNHNDAVVVVVDDSSDSDPGRPNLSLSRCKRAVVDTHPQSTTTGRVVHSDLRLSVPAPLVTGGKEALRHPSSSNDSPVIHPPPTTIDDDEVVIISPSQFPNKQTRRNQFRHDAMSRERNKRMEHKQRQQELLKVKIEAKEAEASAPNLDASLPQEPIPQPRAPEVAGSAGNLPDLVGASVTPPAATRPDGASQQEANLAPHWFQDDPSDIWARALRMKTSRPASRRKIQGRKLNEVRPQIFNFDIMQWENRMKRM